MPRAQTQRQSEVPYAITARCVNREWFNLPMPLVWDIFCDQLFFIQAAFEVEILAFVLMNNHFHLIIRTPKANIDKAMQWFMRETSRELNRHGNRINITYGGPYQASVIFTQHHYLCAYKYLYYNPIAAGICDDVLKYPFSTLPGLLGLARCHVPMVEDVTLFSNVEGTLSWLNCPPKQHHWTAVRRALRKRKFAIGRKDSRPHALERERL